ncbi:jg1093 [Pararge aegeria aegeria]|uniref:Jg1093 protein n=1 Tax=Pararge aegeria aegeria TaxID=348720 RepID=A0A8S4QCR8_9NEOP|nr:jg1093 [Pararge aegeria aegeria]
MSLSIDKCKAVVFTRKRIIPDANIMYNGQRITLENKAKFLGVVLDSRLNGASHVLHVSKKCESGINILRALSGVWWGAHPYSQKLLYNAIIRSHMDYGLFVLDPINKLATEKLNKIQYRCLRIILGAMKSSPTNALQVECVDPPVQIRSQYLCDRFICKVLQLSSHPLFDSLRRLSSVVKTNQDLPFLLNSFRKFTSLPHPIQSSPMISLFSTPFKSLTYKPSIVNLNIHNDTIEANQRFNEIIHSNWPEYLTIYTEPQNYLCLVALA